MATYPTAFGPISTALVGARELLATSVFFQEWVAEEYGVLPEDPDEAAAIARDYIYILSVDVDAEFPRPYCVIYPLADGKNETMTIATGKPDLAVSQGMIGFEFGRNIPEEFLTAPEGERFDLGPGVINFLGWADGVDDEDEHGLEVIVSDMMARSEVAGVGFPYFHQHETTIPVSLSPFKQTEGDDYYSATIGATYGFGIE